MKLEIISKLEELLQSENILAVQKEFNQLSTQFRKKTADELKAAADAISPSEDASKSEDVQTETENSEAPSDSSLGEKLKAAAADVADTIVEIAEVVKEEAAEKMEDVKAVVLEKKTEVSEKASQMVNDIAESVDGLAEEVADKMEEVADEVIPVVESVVEEAKATVEEKTEVAKEKIQEVAAEIKSAVVEAKDETVAKATEVKDEIQVKFEALSDSFRAKIKTAVEKKNKIEKDTVEAAKGLLVELQELVANEENIGKAFSGFNAIKDKWKELPKVSNDAYRDLNVEYNKFVEKFFYNINIYKELKDLDLKHNLDEKLKVLEDQKHLLEVNDVRRLEVEVRLNQDRWNEIGPTFKEEWDKIKDEFWAITKEIYKKVQEFYNERRGEQGKNLEIKQELLNRVTYIDSLELKAHKKWQEKTKEIIEIQKEWKMVGFVPKENASKLWKEFRTTCDHFFEKKRQHYAEVHDIQNANKLAKIALVEKAEALKENADWNETSDVFIKLQKEWKQIGPAHQRDENKLWRKFREACDQFFQAKKGHKQEETGKQSENLAQKKTLLEELAAYTPTSDKKESLNALKVFGDKWRDIGHVPFKDKDALSKQYKEAMDDKYGVLKIDKKQKEQIRFEQKVEDFKGTDKSDFLIRKEHDHIRNVISKLNAEVIQLGNNMGFFANSAGADKFKADIERKIDKAKEEISVLQDRLSVLRKL